MKTLSLKKLEIGNVFLGGDIINFLRRGVKTTFPIPYISKNHNKQPAKFRNDPAVHQILADIQRHIQLP